MPTQPRLLVCLLTLVVLAGCGGGSDKKEKRGYGGAGFVSPVAGASAPRGYPSYASYTPTGTIVADDGFRPWKNGFSFINYGNDVGPTNMTPANVENIFGSEVCISGSGQDCQLTGPAQQWMDALNEAMAGGHCMGFSVTALRMFTGSLKTTAFGAPGTPDLKIGGNTDLQSEIAEGFAYQDLAAVKRAEIIGTPNQILQKLIAGLKSGNETYTMLIFGVDGKPGGHAITPFAVEDVGGGKFNALVYDNNFPQVIRAVHFDTKANTWEYRGGINPSDLNERYFAGAQDTAEGALLRLAPTEPGDKVQPFPFAGDLGDSAGSAGSANGTATRYAQISLKGKVDNHAHLLIEDDDGHKMGYVNGKLVNEIPGANIVEPIADVPNVNELPEPTYQLPIGLRVKVHINGEGMTKPDKEDFTYVAPGVYFQVLEIDAKPGTEDIIHMKGGDGGLVYSTKDTKASAPYVGGGLVETKRGKRATYAFVIKALDVQGASNIGLVLEPDDGYFGVASVAHPGEGDFGYGKYSMAMVRINEAGKTDTWVNPAVDIHGPSKGKLFGQAEIGVITLIGYDQKDYTKNDKVPVILVNPSNNSQQNKQKLTYSP